MRHLLSVLLACCALSPASELSLAQMPADALAPAAALANQTQLAEQIAEVRQQATETEQMDEEVRKQVLEICDKAAAQIAKAKEYAAETARLKQELDAATAEGAPKEPPPTAAPKPLDRMTLEDLKIEQSTADQQASAAREKLQAEVAEIERRAARRLEIPELLLKSKEKQAKAEEALKGDFSADPPLLARAKRLQQQARIVAARQEQLLLEQENRTYDVTARWKTAQRDQAEKALRSWEARLAEINKRIAEQQQLEADLKARQARRAAANAHPAVKELADSNSALAKENAELVQKRDVLRQTLSDAESLSKTIQSRLDTVTEQAEEMKNSPAIGVMLRTEQDKLPKVAEFRERQRQRLAEMSELRLKKYDWKAEQDELSPMDERLRRAIREHQEETGEEVNEEIAGELRKALESRDDILGELTTNANQYLTDIGKLNTIETSIVAKTQELSDYIAERVFWVPSAPRLSLRDLAYTRNFWADVPARLADLNSLGRILLADAARRPELWLLASMVLLLLVAWRHKAKLILYENGELAAKPTVTSFPPTVKALLATLFLALPSPLAIGFLGWRLAASTDTLAYATGGALWMFAMQYGVLDVMRHACRSGGLGTSHFDWNRKGLVSLRRAARPMQLIALPLLAIAVGVEIARDEASINAIGRLSLILSLLVMGAIGFLFFRPHGPLISALVASGNKPWVGRLARMFGPATVLAALGLAIASGLGLHYTAIQLTRRILLSFGVVFACVMVRALLLRWLLMAYRKAAMQRAREKRQAMLDAQENAPSEAAAVEVDPAVSLSDINQQARSLVGVGVAASIVGAMLLVWGDVLPALNALNDPDAFGLWRSGIPDEDGSRPWITLAGLLLALGTFTLTWFGGRNIPGLLEIVLFQKLPLDAGARYAATTVSSYVIVVIGGVIGMGLLGVGWQSVQWLVAAMTVGLGFGLQEIFANFVSGIILLFERPVRPGDIVTIGDVSGVVTRIRIRATTVQDWDNKELIVPNREFITGNLINWTLSSRMLRHVLKVGVAYGSDTRLATELLYKVAQENPDVTDTPEPFVLFDSFGDSTLNFELRVFTQDLTNLMRMRHELMLAVDDAFRANGIEIAFPQRDLHIRSMPAELAKLAEQSQRDRSAEHRLLEEAHSEPGFDYSRER